MTLVTVPDQGMLERLSPAPEGIELRVWDFTEPVPPEHITLAVVPYLRGPRALRLLEGRTGTIVQSQTLGYDSAAANLPAGLTYCNAVEVHEASTAELALALTLAAQRDLDVAVRNHAAHVWEGRRSPGLAGCTVLLLGVGGVGREIEARLLPFDVGLLRVARTERDGVHALDALPDLLPTADIVIVGVPLTAETTGLVDAAFLAAMKDDALLVNIARGKVVDTGALLAELQSGRLRAALDVVDPEPLPADHPLWDAPGLILTPHVGGHTAAMTGRMDRVVREQLRRLAAGEPPANVVIQS